MADNKGIPAQFPIVFNSQEELEAYRRRTEEVRREAPKDWVEAPNGVFYPPDTQEAQTTSVSPSVTPAQIMEHKKGFSTIRQGQSTNALSRISNAKGNDIVKVDPISGTATIESGSLTMTIPKFSTLSDVKTSTHQFFDAIVIAFTESGAKSPTVFLAVEEYMNRRGLKDRKEARKQIVADANALLRLPPITWDEIQGKQKIPYAGVNIVDSWGWADKEKTTIQFTFTQGFYGVLLRYPVMAYPDQLQRVNSNNNPNSYYLLRKIAEHKNMNVGKRNENIIAVKTLLKSSPYLPSYETVMKGNRNIRSRIIDPFERDMDFLAETLGWELCKSLGEPFTEEELDELYDYKNYSRAYVKITWRDYPDQNARLKEIAERKEEAKKKRRARSKKKKEPQATEDPG